MDSRRSDNYITLALNAYISEDTEQAVSFFEKALSFPNSKEEYINIYYNLAQIYDELNENEKAIEMYEKIISIDFQAQAFYGKAIIFEKLEEYDLAEKSFRVAIDLDGTFRDARFFLANLFDIQGDYKQAIIEYKNFLKIFPEDYMGLNNLGSIYEEVGEYDKSLLLLEKSIGIREDYYLSHFNLAVVLYRLGRKDESIEHYYRAKELKPDHGNIYLNLSAIYIAEGELEKSEKILKEGLIHNPNMANLYYNLACTSFKLSLKDEGLKYLKKAISLNSDLYLYGMNDPDFKDIKFSEEFRNLE